MEGKSSIFGIPIEIAFAIFALLVSVNMVYLDIVVVNRLSTLPQASSVIIQPVTKTQINTCPESCITQMQQLVSLATPSSTSIATPTPSPRQTTTTYTTSAVKEFYVPFGSGSGVATDWMDIPGMTVSVDTKNYARIKTVTFEVSISIPTGNETAYVRLFNATDQHPVWFSDVSLEGGTPQLVASQPITLDVGNKTYQVQIKTSLGYTANLDQARLKIITY